MKKISFILVIMVLMSSLVGCASEDDLYEYNPSNDLKREIKAVKVDTTYNNSNSYQEQGSVNTKDNSFMDIKYKISLERGILYVAEDYINNAVVYYVNSLPRSSGVGIETIHKSELLIDNVVITNETLSEKVKILGREVIDNVNIYAIKDDIYNTIIYVAEKPSYEAGLSLTVEKQK